MSLRNDMQALEDYVEDLNSLKEDVYSKLRDIQQQYNQVLLRNSKTNIKTALNQFFNKLNKFNLDDFIYEVEELKEEINQVNYNVKREDKKNQVEKQMLINKRNTYEI